MNCVELINEIHHGRWEVAFPDPMQQRKFEEFLAKNDSGTGFGIRYVIPTVEGDWSVWHQFTYLPPNQAIAECLWMPEDGYEHTMPDEMDGLPIFEFEWPVGISFEIEDDDDPT